VSAYAEDQLVEQPSIGLFAELGLRKHNVGDGGVAAPAQRQCNERVSVNAAISSAGETGGLAEIGTCMLSLKMAVSPRDEND
jgi:hypothetical protein